MKKVAPAFALRFILLLLWASPVFADSIDTTPYWDGENFVSNFGESRNQSFGQTFTVGTATELDQFTLWLYLFGDSNPFKFAGYLMAWDGLKATGPVIYESDGFDLESEKDKFKKLNFNTKANLAEGQQYVFFLNVSNFLDGLPDSAGLGFVKFADFNYTGGGFVATDASDHCAPSDFSCVNTGVDWTFVGQSDLAFKAKFKTAKVPEPANWLLMVSGLLIVGRLKSSHLNHSRDQVSRRILDEHWKYERCNANSSRVGLIGGSSSHSAVSIPGAALLKEIDS